MFSRLMKAVLFVCLMLLSFGVEAGAQETISPAKRELIKELVVLSGGQKTAEAIINSALDQNEKDLAEMLTQMVGQDSNLTPGERAALQQRRREVIERTNKRFRELFNEKINFAQVIEEISYSIYDKFFSETELRDLVAFYKSPTGRKTVEVMPQLFTESMMKTSEILMPKIQQIGNQIMEEEKARLENMQPPSKPAPSKKKKRRTR